MKVVDGTSRLFLLFEIVFGYDKIYVDFTFKMLKIKV